MSESKSKPKREKLSASELEEIRDLLLARRQDIVNTQATQLSELSDPTDKHHLVDLEEMASDSNGFDSLCEIIDMEDATVAQIDDALEKIGEGSYGICKTCEMPIPRARLEALPFAGRCIDCQRLEELKTEV